MKTTSVKPVRVLMLGSAALGEDFASWAGEHAMIIRVNTFDEAVEALGHEAFDVVVSHAADFLPFHGIHFTRQAAAILDSVSQGVAILHASGELEWANPNMLAFPADVRERVCQFCVSTFSWAENEAKSGASMLRGRRCSFTTSAGRRYDVVATPIIDLHQRVTQVAVVVWDATGATRYQDKIEAIDRAGRELLRVDVSQFSRLDPQERMALLEQKAIRCVKELLHFDNFEVRILDPQTGSLDLVLSSGMPADAADVRLYCTPDGNGICGYVAARGRSYICPDTSADSRYLPGIENGRSSLTVPLWLNDKVMGVVNYENTRLAAFTEDDRQFAEIFGRYIVLALHLFELLATERQTTTGRLGSDVMAQITGPLNDILTGVESLVEDYIGHDDLRHRLRDISENAVSIRETVRELTQSKPGVTGLSHRRTRKHDATLANKRILIADDEQMLRDTVRDVLSGYGCHVSTASDGLAAIELIAQQAFDLILSDIKMPQKTGYEVFAAAKEANPTTPVILTTGFGYDPNHSIVRARREGLAAVLFKPFKVDQLLTEIRTALATESCDKS